MHGSVSQVWLMQTSPHRLLLTLGYSSHRSIAWQGVLVDAVVEEVCVPVVRLVLVPLVPVPLVSVVVLSVSVVADVVDSLEVEVCVVLETQVVMLHVASHSCSLEPPTPKISPGAQCS